MMLLRILPIAILLGITALVLSDPPEEVRLQNFTGFNNSEKFASIPVCYANHQLKLGDTVAEVSEEFNRNIELNWDDQHTFQTAEWKEECEDSKCDSLVKCTFNKGKLAALQIITSSEKQFIAKSELLQTLTSVYPCIYELMPVLNFGTNLRFEEENLAFYQSFKLIEKDHKFAGIYYEMRYSDVIISNPLFNS